jgi:hypothetical protein
MNYINRKIKEYTRLEEGSLDEGNVKTYRTKRKEWEQKKVELVTKQAANFKIEYLEDELEGLDTKLLNEQKQQLVDLTNKFPKMQRFFNEDNPLYIGAGYDKDALAWNTRQKDYQINKIAFNKTVYKDYNTIIEKERRSVKINWSMPCSDENLSIFTVTHEYGHVIHNALIREYITENPLEYEQIKKKSIEKAIKGNTKAGRKIISDFENKQIKGFIDEIMVYAKLENPNVKLLENLSDYGKTQYSEAFAEIFANSQCGEPNILGRAMNKFLEKRLQ